MPPFAVVIQMKNLNAGRSLISEDTGSMKVNIYM